MRPLVVAQLTSDNRRPMLLLTVRRRGIFRRPALLVKPSSDSLAFSISSYCLPPCRADKTSSRWRHGPASRRIMKLEMPAG